MTSVKSLYSSCASIKTQERLRSPTIGVSLLIWPCPRVLHPPYEGLELVMVAVAKQAMHYNDYGLKDKFIGSYSEVVQFLLALIDRCRKWEELRIAYVGHGGRDAWLAWALIDVASRTGKEVHHYILSSCWSNEEKFKGEEGVEAMKRYMSACNFTNVELEKMSWGKPTNEIVK